LDNPTHKQERQAAYGLVERITSGDKQAEAEMVARYNRGLRYLLRRKARDSQMAEDLLQETWAVALQKIRGGGLTDPGRLAGYLCGIAKNLAIGDRRRDGRQKTSANSDVVDLAADDSPSPFQRASRAEVCGHVRDLLKGLKRDRDREILMRFYVQEEDKQQICFDMNLDSAHFNRVLFRARQRLKDVVLRSEMHSKLRVVK
jgi:RNA polymerase sigma-70 factor (ECF subfamily)